MTEVIIMLSKLSRFLYDKWYEALHLIMAITEPFFNNQLSNQRFDQ